MQDDQKTWSRHIYCLPLHQTQERRNYEKGNSVNMKWRERIHRKVNFETRAQEDDSQCGLTNSDGPRWLQAKDEDALFDSTRGNVLQKQPGADHANWSRYVYLQPSNTRNSYNQARERREMYTAGNGVGPNYIHASFALGCARSVDAGCCLQMVR